MTTTTTTTTMTENPNLVSRSTPPITTSQMVALSYTYRIIFRVLISIPLFLLLAQLVLTASFFLLDTITNHHTLITIVAALLIAQTIQRLIVKSAPTDRQAMETTKKLQYSLPVVMLIPSILFARTIITSMEDILGLQAILAWTPPIFSLAVTLRISLGSVLLGCSMCAQYIGPQSIGT
jgi:hypothetical protein